MLKSNYKYKILSLIFKNEIDINDINLMPLSFFDDDKLAKNILKKVKLVSSKNHIIPSLDYIIEKINDDLETSNSKDSQFEKELYKNIVDKIIKEWDSRDLPLVKHDIIKLIKKYKLKDIILEAANGLSDKDYSNLNLNKIIESFRYIDSIGSGKEIGLQYDIENLETRYKEMKRYPISTGHKVFDRYLDGGLGSGEMGVIVAPPGVGKTWILVSLGAEALKQGLKVLHYTLELSDEYVAKRYDSYLSKINFKKLDNMIPEATAKLKELNKKINITKFQNDNTEIPLENPIKSNLVIKRYPTKGASISTLNSHAKLLINSGWTPDLIIIDYGDLLNNNDYKDKSNTYLVSGGTYEQIRGFGGEINVPVWTGSQSSRDSMNHKVIYGDTISESIKKLQIADAVISFNRFDEEAYFHFIKSRFDEDKITFKSQFNSNNGNFVVYPNDDKIIFDSESNNIRSNAIQKQKNSIMSQKAQTNIKKYLSKHV